MDQVLQQLLNAAGLLEQAPWDTQQDADYSNLLASALRQYVGSTPRTELDDVQQSEALARVAALHQAIYSRNLFDAYAHSQALIGSLPGEPTTLPTPPWKR